MSKYITDVLEQDIVQMVAHILLECSTIGNLHGQKKLETILIQTLLLEVEE